MLSVNFQFSYFLIAKAADWFLLLSTTAIIGKDWERYTLISEKSIPREQLNEVFNE